MILFFFGSLLPHLLSFFGFDAYLLKSMSMKHQNEDDFYAFWEGMGYNRSEVERFPFYKGIDVGDVIVMAKDENYSVGDVVVHKSKPDDRIRVHRLLKYNETHFSIMGDWYTSESITDINYITNSNYPISLLEGKVVLRFPRFGILHIFILCLRYVDCNLWECMTTQNCHLGQ